MSWVFPLTLKWHHRGWSASYKSINYEVFFIGFILKLLWFVIFIDTSSKLSILPVLRPFLYLSSLSFVFLYLIRAWFFPSLLGLPLFLLPGGVHHIATLRKNLGAFCIHGISISISSCSLPAIGTVFIFSHNFLLKIFCGQIF